MLDQYAGMLKSLAYRYKRLGEFHGYAFEDLVQEAYLEAIRAINNFEDRGCSLSTYIYTRVQGKLLRLFRDNKYMLGTREQRRTGTVEPLVSLECPIGENTYILDVLGDNGIDIEKIELKQSISHLPDNLKEVISLKYYGGYTQNEIAKMLNTNQVNISRKEKKAINLIREEMGVTVNETRTA